MVKAMLGKVNWEGLKSAASNIGNSDIADVSTITRCAGERGHSAPHTSPAV